MAVLVEILVGSCDLHGSIDCTPNPGAMLMPPRMAPVPRVLAKRGAAQG